MNTILLSFSVKNSSVSEFFLEFANIMVQDHHVVIISDSEEQHFFEVSPKIEIVKWPSSRPTHLKDFRFLMALVKKYRPNTMISNFGSVNIFLCVGFLLKVKNRIAWYHTLTTQLEDKKLLKLRKGLVYKMATKIVANSEAAKKDLIANFKVDKSKVQVIYNAVRDYKITGNEVTENSLVFVGRLDAIKGLDILFAALPIVIREFPNTKLTVVGGNNLNKINKYKELAGKLKIDNHVVFLGNQGKAKVLKTLSSAYITIVPSLVEAFGYVVIESFSVKTPVIGSNTTGIAEIVRAGKDGLLFEPGKHEDLAEKIMILFKDKNARENYSSNCYKRFQDMFEINANAKKLVSTLNQKKQ